MNTNPFWIIKGIKFQQFMPSSLKKYKIILKRVIGIFNNLKIRLKILCIIDNVINKIRRMVKDYRYKYL